MGAPSRLRSRQSQPGALRSLTAAVDDPRDDLRSCRLRALFNLLLSMRS